MIRAVIISLALCLTIATSARSQAANCGARLEESGVPHKLASPLPEPDRIGLLASIHLALNDPSGRGTWPMSEIDIALPCEIASFPAGDDTWIISAGEGYAPLRWARAKDQDDIFYLANGPSIKDAQLWSQNLTEEIKGLSKPLHYLVGVAGERHYIFNIYDGAPSGKMLADDIHAIIARKASPVAVYESKGNAASLLLPTQSRRTSKVFRPERLIGDGSATLYGPDGHFFTPAPGAAALLRGSDLTCHYRYGSFEQVTLGVLEPEDSKIDLSCHYESGNSSLTIFSTRMPNATQDRIVFSTAIRQLQDEDGVSARLPGFKTGPRNLLQAGQTWIDRSQTGQGLWFMRRGDYVYEIRATFPVAESKALFDAVESFVRSTEPETDAP